LLVVAIVLTLVPAAAVVRTVVLRATDPRPGRTTGELADTIQLATGPAWGLMAHASVYALGIAALATVLGALAAWSIHRRPTSRGGWTLWGPLICVPLALPNYLVYWAFGQIRAPGTWIGNAIEGAVASGNTWVPLVAARTMAVLGLALWAWPIPALAIGAALSRVPPDVRDALRLDAGPWACAVQHFRIAMPGVILGAAAVALLMLGSAVPLHLAQAPTISLAAWQVLSLAPGSPQAWVALWPVLAPAAVAAVLVARAVAARARRGWADDDAGGARSGGGGGARGRSWWARPWAAWCLMALSVPMPLVAMAVTIRDWSAVGRLGWQLGDAGWVSARVAAWVGLGFVALTLLGARALATSRSPRGMPRRAGILGWANGARGAGVGGVVGVVALALLTFALLAPGLLVGAAWSHVFAIPADAPVIGVARAVGDSDAAIVLAHLTRFGALAVLLGAGLAWLDGVGQRDLRRVDGAIGVWAWLRAGGLGGSLAGAAVALGAAWTLGAVVSFHEIETTVMVQPPGSQTVAQVVLGYLHFSRLQEMSVAGLALIGSAGVLAILVATAARGLVGGGARWAGGGGGLGGGGSPGVSDRG
jgi:ABC-type spermidine/putrescine transport system permease subunit II